MNNFSRGGSRSSFGGGDRGGDRGGRRSFGGGRSGGRSELHDAVCSKCGNPCKVPFKPTGVRPVFCSNCFEGETGRDGGSSRGGDRGGDFRPRSDFRGDSRGEDARPSMSAPSADTKEIKQLLKAIDAKLDMLLSSKSSQSVEVTEE